LDHCIRKLNFAAGAAFLSAEDPKKVRLQDIASGQNKVGRRTVLRWLLHHIGDGEHFALPVTDSDHTVLIDALVRDFLHGHDVCVRRQFARRIDHLGEAAALVLH
jgi:hypothetical protein